jgi:hypothetical protein
MNSLKAMAYDGHIKTWHNGSPVQSIADTSLDGSTGTAHLYQDAYVSGSQHAYYDDFWMTRGNTIQVTGLPTGWKASVAGVTAVEVGGTATIDLAGADLKQAGVSILDASGAVKGNTAPANGVWGGDVFTYHAPAP